MTSTRTATPALPALALTALALTAAVLAGGPASPSAAADPNAADSVMGSYTFEAKDRESATWTLTPCPGNNTGCVRVSETGNAKRAPWSADAHLTVGSWIMFAAQPDAILCEDGTAVPGVNTYSWDAVELTGSASILSKGACGTEPASISIPFTLTKTGAGPAQLPTAPIDVEPLLPGPPPAGAPAAPPPGPLPAAPLPAESPANQVDTPAVVPAPADQLTEAEVAEPGFNADRR